MKNKQEYNPVIPSILSNGKKESKYPFHVDMPSYVSGHDIVYLSPSYEGYEGFPLGNGDLGGMVWCTPNGLNIQINKIDTWDATFTLNCVGGFLVSSELDENKEIRFVMIESVLGNECKLVNPWNDKKIVVESINPGKTKVDFKINNNNLVIFST